MQQKTSKRRWRREDTGAVRWSFSWLWREMLSAWATCGGSLTSATKTEGVSKCDAHCVLPNICDTGMHCCVLCKYSGAFLVPYLVFVVTCGVPLFLLETTMGQYTQEGGITCWRKLCPLAEGILFISAEQGKSILYCANHTNLVSSRSSC